MKSFKDYAGIREESSPDYDLLLTEASMIPVSSKQSSWQAGPDQANRSLVEKPD